MKLPPDQVERFYSIWVPLLHYVNEQRHLVEPFPPHPREAILPVENVQKLRDALWADDALRERFIELNPFGFSSADLSLLESWRYRVAGNFFVMRYLKKYTVFLSGESGEA